MAELTHPVLGSINLASPGFWEAEISLGGHAVSVDLTIEEGGVATALLRSLPQSLADFERFDRAARAAILSDARSGDAEASAVLYLTHHHEELAPADYQRLFGASAPDLANPEPLLRRLALVRVGFYPEQGDRRIILDYSVDPDATDYVLCVAFESEDKVTAVDLES